MASGAQGAIHRMDLAATGTGRCWRREGRSVLCVIPSRMLCRHGAAFRDVTGLQRCPIGTRATGGVGLPAIPIIGSSRFTLRFTIFPARSSTPSA